MSQSSAKLSTFSLFVSILIHVILIGIFSISHQNALFAVTKDELSMEVSYVVTQKDAFFEKVSSGVVETQKDLVDSKIEIPVAFNASQFDSPGNKQVIEKATQMRRSDNENSRSIYQQHSGVDSEAFPIGSLNQPPSYPENAREKGIEGHLVVKLDVSQMGDVKNLEIASTSGYEMLDREALKALNHWKFYPAQKLGKAVDSTIHIPITFRLE